MWIRRYTERKPRTGQRTGNEQRQQEDRLISVSFCSVSRFAVQIWPYLT